MEQRAQFLTKCDLFHHCTVRVAASALCVYVCVPSLFLGPGIDPFGITGDTVPLHHCCTLEVAVSRCICVCAFPPAKTGNENISLGFLMNESELNRWRGGGGRGKRAECGISPTPFTFTPRRPPTAVCAVEDRSTFPKTAAKGGTANYTSIIRFHEIFE